MSERGFRITSGKGFHVTFANGWTVSVQLGGGNYCENHHIPVEERDVRCRDAEVAVWGPGGDFVRPDYENWDDDVSGWRSPEDVLKLLTWVASQGDDR